MLEQTLEDFMKLIATLFTFALLITSSAEAVERDLYANVRDQVADYYEATGEWTLVKVKNIERVDYTSAEFVLMSAKAHIQNNTTVRGMTETCLVSFVAENGEFFSINCF